MKIIENDGSVIKFCVTNVHFIFSKLGAALRSLNVRLPVPPDGIPPNSSVYIQMKGDDEVFTGTLHHLNGSTIPGWMSHPHQPSNSVQNVYVKMPHLKDDLVSSIRPFEYTIPADIHGQVNEEYRCFIRIGRYSILAAFLEPYYHQPLFPHTHPRVFVRMPNNSVYMGLLEYTDGHRPIWFPTEHPVPTRNVV